MSWQGSVIGKTGLGAGKKSGVKNETRRIQQKYETCLTRQSQIKNESVLSYDSKPDFEDTDHSLFVLPHLLPPIFCQQVLKFFAFAPPVSGENIFDRFRSEVGQRDLASTNKVFLQRVDAESGEHRGEQVARGRFAFGDRVAVGI